MILMGNLGHTGDIPTSILIPQVVEICNKAKSPLTGEKVHVVAAGAMYNGKSLAAALAFGAEAVWVSKANGQPSISC